MKTILFLIIFFNLFYGGYAQTVLLEQNLKADTIRHESGQNLKHFLHGYAGLGFIAGAPSGTGNSIINGLSNSFLLGLRYKRKFSGWYAAGYSCSISSDSYRIRQNQHRDSADGPSHKSEKLVLTNLSVDVYNRFNFGKRGNIIGKYIDLGVYGTWTPFSKLSVKDVERLNNKDVISKKNTRRLSYIEPFGYGLTARMGVNRYSLFVTYRASGLFKNSFFYGDLPDYIVGLQIGLY